MRGKRLYSYEDALRWATQSARALQYMHEAKPQVLHRDLKSENILLTERGRGGDVRVMDFGLMKLRSARRARTAVHVACTARRNGRRHNRPVTRRDGHTRRHRLPC